MNQFTIQFQFEGRDYIADVTEIGGLDDTQYAVSPRDEKLTEKFKTNVIRKVKGNNEYQYALPAAPGGVEFMEALAKGLSAVRS